MTFLEIADPAVAANELLELFPKVPAVRGGLPMGKCVISRTAIFFLLRGTRNAISTIWRIINMDFKSKEFYEGLVVKRRKYEFTFDEKIKQI